jgi:hypothetical protein
MGALGAFVMLELIASTTIALSPRDMSFLVCMHGEDWIVSTESFDGFDKHMRNKIRELFSGSQNVKTNLYHYGIACARQQAKEMGIEVPEEYMP